MSQMQMRCGERNLLAIESCGRGDPGLAARWQQRHGLTWLPPLPGQGGQQPCAREIPTGLNAGITGLNAGITGLNPMGAVPLNPTGAVCGSGGCRNVPPIPGSEGYPRSPSWLRAVRHQAGHGLQSALTGSSILVRAGRCCLGIHQSIIPQNALPASILIPSPPRVTAPLRRHRGVNLTTQGH